MRKIVPAIKESGGYIFFFGCSIPDSVNLVTYKRIVALARELAKLLTALQFNITKRTLEKHTVCFFTVF